MYRNKNLKKLYNRCKKSTAFAVSLCLLLGVMIVGTVAFLLDKSDPVTNTFTPSKITTTVDEKLEDSTKKDVSIKNTGDTDAWIRAKVIITWQDEAGNVYGSQPKAGTDYTIEWNLPENPSGDAYWVSGVDGFYYWIKPIAPKGNTGILIKECTYQKDKAPVGYALTVEIIASGIQSKPASVFDTEWASSGLEVNEKNGNYSLIKKSVE